MTEPNPTAHLDVLNAGEGRAVNLASIGGKPISGLLFPGVENVHDISDGHHTFGEVYDHRRALTVALARVLATAKNGVGWRSWKDVYVIRSRNHHPEDGPMFPGYFIVVFTLADLGQVSYHYKLKWWDQFEGVHESDHAPRWDGHTAAESIERLTEFLT